MKLKAFGLVEAIIATAMLLIFFIGVTAISLKSAAYYDKSSLHSDSQIIAQDFLNRLDILNRSGYLAYAGRDNSKSIPLKCLESSEWVKCQDSIAKELPLSLYPFGEMTEASSGEYLNIKKSFLEAHKLSGSFILKSKLNKQEDSLFEIEIEIKAQSKKSNTDYKVTQVFTRK